jgi:hypothetical protein
MPKYFYLLETWVYIADAQGQELPDDNAARELAERIAFDILQNRSPEDFPWRVVVTDEAGEKIAEASRPWN